MKFHKSMLCAVLAISFCVPSTVSASSININGMLQDYSVEFKEEQGRKMLEGKELAKILSAKAIWSAEEETLTFTKGNDKAIFKNENTAYSFNGKTKYFVLPLKMTESDLILPVKSVAELFGASTKWESAADRMSITTAKNAGNLNSIVDDFYQVPANAEIITYEEALNSSIRINSTLKNLKDNVELIEKNRKLAVTGYKDASMVGADATAIELMRTIDQLDKTTSGLPLNEDIVKGATEYLLRSSIAKVRQNELDRILLTETIKLNQSDSNNINLKHSLGMASDNELKIVKQTLEKSKSSFRNLEILIESDKAALNKVMGMDASKNVYVEINLDESFPTVDVDSYATAKISDDPSIKLKKKAVEQAEYASSTSVSAIQNWQNTEKNEVDKIKTTTELSAASRDLNDEMDTMRQNIRTTYSNMASLRELIEVDNVIAIEKTKIDYNSAVTGFSTGVATQYQIDATKLLILNSEIAREKNRYNYDTLKFAFDNPFLLSTKK